MTSDNITKLQILATMDDGTHLMAITDDKILIRFVGELCQFVRLKEDLFDQCSLKELVELSKLDKLWTHICNRYC